MNFKEFRKSQGFKEVAEEIADNAKRIIDFATCCDSNFGSINMDELLGEYREGNYDFNDQVIIRLCKSMDLVLITHDKDFKDSGIEILTANRYLLE